MKDEIVIRGARIITLDAQDRVLDGDVTVSHGRISAIEPRSSADLSSVQVIEAHGKVLLPGFVQTHIHLCQTLFRGSADDLSLIDWLKTRIWPMEAAHTPESIRTSAQLGVAELIRGGTTCALTMETVHHTQSVLEVIAESGFRAIVGKCMMDQGDEVPAGLLEQSKQSIAESLSLIDQWNGFDDNRIACCFAPRFALSCSRELLVQVAALAKERGVLVHTHASENLTEIAEVERLTGRRNIQYLSEVGLTSSNVVLAHCVHLNDSEMDILSRTNTRVAHCPSSNLKLASGIAAVSEMRARGILVSLGADGAPCNNRLDMFSEMRLAAMLQKVRESPKALPAATVLKMATIEGARALHLEHEIGSIEVGKRADLQLLDLNSLHTVPSPDPVSTIVYSASPQNVETVIIAGKVVLRDGRLETLNESEILNAAGSEAAKISSILR